MKFKIRRPPKPAVEMQRVEIFREQKKFPEALDAARALVRAESAGSSSLPYLVMAESRLNEGQREEALQVLREAFAQDPSNEEVRAFLGRVEAESGNYNEALSMLSPIDVASLGSRIATTALEMQNRPRPRRAKSPSLEPSDSSIATRLAVHLVEGVAWRAVVLADHLNQVQEGIATLKQLLDAVEPVLLQLWDAELRGSVGYAAALLARFYRDSGAVDEAMTTYRRCLLGGHMLTPELTRTVQKELALVLLYGGVEAEVANLGGGAGGVYAPSNNLEEAALLLLLAQRGQWEADSLEHLSFALSLLGQTSLLAECYEAVLPGVYTRPERWYSLACAQLAAGQCQLALVLLRKCLKESPEDVPALMLAARACALSDAPTAQREVEDGVHWAERAVQCATGPFACLRGKALHLLGVLLSRRSHRTLSDSERQTFSNRSVAVLQQAAETEPNNPNILYDLARQLAEERKLSGALERVRGALKASGGCHVTAWRLLALVLSAQKKWEAALGACEAGLGEARGASSGGSQGGRGQLVGMLRTAAKIQAAAGQGKAALESCQAVLALLKEQQKRNRLLHRPPPSALEEAQVWVELAEAYLALAHLGDALACAEKACALVPQFPGSWHVLGEVQEAAGKVEEAKVAYDSALAADPNYYPSVLRMGVIYRQSGALPLARSFLTEALQGEPMSHVAWFNLGLVHKEEGSKSKEIECFHSALALQATAPAASFRTLPRAL